MTSGHAPPIEHGSAAPTPVRPRRRLAPGALLGGAVVAFWLAMAVLGPHLAPYAAGSVAGTESFAGIGRGHPLGTDYLGRDMLSRVLLGARYTVGLALLGTLIASLSGTLLGLCAAVRGGWFDAVLSRLLDALISMPNKMMALVLVAAFGPSIPVLVGTVALIYTPGCFRIARSMAVNINAMDFVAVARARGERTWFIMLDEVLPNMLAPMLTDFGLRFVFVVLILSGMSFLGIGVQPPNADWGSLVRENIEGLAYGAPAVIVPALAIATLTVGVNLLIDNLPGRGPAGADRR